MNLIEKAIHYASEVQAGQLDKSGFPLILHPLFATSRMTSDKARVIAVLHDILEDTDKTAEDLRAEGFPNYIVETVVVLARKQGNM
jgi:(p)ppGpp synthase/HD superfamily hydrolase